MSQSTESGPYVRIFIAPSQTGVQPLSLTIVELPGGVRVVFGGDVDENANFGEILRRARGRVEFDLAEVRRINSCGSREWVNLSRDLAALPISIEYHGCSPAVVAQLNTISNFRGDARVVSFLAPYVCETCNREEHRLIEVATPPRATRLPEFTCGLCATPLVFDDIPDRYLSFLKEV